MAAATTSSAPALRRPLVANLCIVALCLSTLAGFCQPESAAYDSSVNTPGQGIQAWPLGPHRMDSDDDSHDLIMGDPTSTEQHHLTSIGFNTPEEEADAELMENRMLRGALNKNFLRFGRGGLNKNFLRFGRGGLNKNFLRFGRGGLNKNFLRFGRGGLNKNFLRFGRGDNENEDGAIYGPSGETGSLDWIRGDATFDEQEPEINHEEKRKPLSLNLSHYSSNLHRPNLSGGKRNSLDRNFLRFGKRSSHLDGGGDDDSASSRRPPNTVDEEQAEEERKPSLDGADVDEGGSSRTRRSVLLLTSPWMKRELAPRHGGAIRRRSLQENFIRFGRR